MKTNFYELTSQLILSILICILLSINGILIWLFIKEWECSIYTLIFITTMILLVSTIYLYFIRCKTAKELVFLEIMNRSVDVVNVIENIKKAYLTTKVEIIWYKEIPTEVEEYDSSLERYQTVTKNIEQILYKHNIEEIYISEDNTENFNINKEKNFTLVLIEKNFTFNKDVINYIEQKIESIDKLYNSLSTRREIKYNIGLTTQFDKILLNKNVDKIDWWIEYSKIFYWVFTVLLLNVVYRIWLNKFFNFQKLVVKKVGKEILG